MSSFDQVDFLANRETQQRQLEARAKLPDAASFHRKLAEHYAALLEQARQLTP